jgi:hypothetical protein
MSHTHFDGIFRISLASIIIYQRYKPTVADKKTLLQL